MLVILVLEEWRQENYEFKMSLGCILRPCFKKPKLKQSNIQEVIG